MASPNYTYVYQNFIQDQTQVTRINGGGSHHKFSKNSAFLYVARTYNDGTHRIIIFEKICGDEFYLNY